MNGRIQLMLHPWSGKNTVCFKCDTLQCQMLWFPTTLQDHKTDVACTTEKKVTISCQTQLVLPFAGKKISVSLIGVIAGCSTACLDPILFIDRWVKISSFQMNKLQVNQR